MDDYNQIQLYQKHIYPSGRVRYIPTEKVYDYELVQPNTTYLVKSLSGGGISTRYIREEISPNYLPILSALRDFEEEALNILHDSNQFKPNKELTKEEQEAWTKLSGRNLVFEGISMHDLVARLIGFLEMKIKEEINESKQSNNCSPESYTRLWRLTCIFDIRSFQWRECRSVSFG